jgi:hypothetical protein
MMMQAMNRRDSEESEEEAVTQKDIKEYTSKLKVT